MAIEYTDCREYGVGNDGIWKIDFDRVQEKELDLNLRKDIIWLCKLINSFNNIHIRVSHRPYNGIKQ
ncbi:hypothetical protein LY28_00798 [Ruminiclostridium sufflavum DSM 19573]|uniref:Uncharacterized protein n=1 Tax=Ruminiclostridium sufflavum DSM 19573 TaxID=1121337 RepID=A0A318XQL6_9FIRM|nr:hypothetical protein [Ruminiclostridium sufflavum]PYG89578.1 hypothetical protein LY28_00798 [Ruminiclostridium sufflavum DSM 19573]